MWKLVRQLGSSKRAGAEQTKGQDPTIAKTTDYGQILQRNVTHSYQKFAFWHFKNKRKAVSNVKISSENHDLETCVHRAKRSKLKNSGNCGVHRSGYQKFQPLVSRKFALYNTSKKNVKICQNFWYSKHVGAEQKDQRCKNNENCGLHPSATEKSHLLVSESFAFDMLKSKDEERRSNEKTCQKASALETYGCESKVLNLKHRKNVGTYVLGRNFTTLYLKSMPFEFKNRT